MTVDYAAEAREHGAVYIESLLELGESFDWEEL
jgi:hypothetical protein